MKIKIMRHDCGSQDANGDVKHLRVLHDFPFGNETSQNGDNTWPRKNNFQQETSANEENQRNDQRFNVTKAFVLKIQNDEHIQRGDAYAPEQRDFEQQVQRDSRSDDLRQVAGTMAISHKNQSTMVVGLE